jgi:hypothetical protein
VGRVSDERHSTGHVRLRSLQAQRRGYMQFPVGEVRRREKVEEGSGGKRHNYGLVVFCPHAGACLLYKAKSYTVKIHTIIFFFFNGARQIVRQNET